MTRTQWSLLALFLFLALGIFLRSTLFPPTQSSPLPTSKLLSTLERKKEASEVQWPPRIQKNKLPTKETDPGIQAALASISGRVLWKDNHKPLVGILVRAFPNNLGEVFPLLGGKMGTLPTAFLPESRAKTNEKGRFLLRGLNPLQGYVLSFGKQGEGNDLCTIDQSLKPGGTLDIGDLFLERRGTLRGIILDHENRPISGAHLIALDLPSSMLDLGLEHWDPKGFVVKIPPRFPSIQALPPHMEDLVSRLPFAQTRSAQDGHFVLKGIPGGEVHLLVLHQDHRSLLRSLKMDEGEQRDLGSLQMERGRILKGVLVDQAGNPMKRIELALAPKTGSGISLARASTHSDGKGRFQFRGLGEGRHDLFVHLQGPDQAHMPWTLHGPFRSSDPDQAKTIRVSMKRGLTLSIQVKSKEGKPLPEAKVLCQPKPGLDYLGGSLLEGRPRQTGTPRRPETVSSSGPSHLLRVPRKALWSFVDYPAGWYLVRVSHPSYAPSRRILYLDPKTSKQPFEITLFPSTQVHLLVENRAGEEVSSAEVFLLDPSGEEPLRLGKSDMRGQLHLTQIPKKPVILLARHPAYGLGRTKTFVPSSHSPVLITLPGTGRAEGTLTSSAKPYPGPPLRLQASPEDNATRLLLGNTSALSGEGGRFVFPSLSPGTYLITVFPAGTDRRSPGQLALLRMEPRPHRLSHHPLVVKEGQTSRIKWNLYATRDFFRKRKGKISGKILAKGVKGMKLLVQLCAGSYFLYRTPDSNGEFSFDHLPGGDLTVSLMGKTGNQTRALLGISVYMKPGDQKQIRFELSFGTLKGIILGPEGNPLDHQALFLKKWGSPSALKEVVTDERGEFHAQIPSGRWSIFLKEPDYHKLGFALPDRIFQIGPKQATQVRLRARLPKTVQGTVLLDLSQIHPDWRKDLKEIFPSSIVFQSRSGNFFWSVPIAKMGFPTHIPPKKTGLGNYRIYAYSPEGFWTTLFEFTEKNRRNFQVTLPPPKALTLPKEKEKGK